MGDYTKTVHIDASAGRVFEALTSPGGLSSWWAPVTGTGTRGGELRFRVFDKGDPMLVHVTDAERPVSVTWVVRSCAQMEDWEGTRPTFTLRATPAGTCDLDFRHEGLVPQLACYAQCRAGWDFHLTSLRDYLEGGRGSPLSDG